MVMTEEGVRFASVVSPAGEDLFICPEGRTLVILYTEDVTLHRFSFQMQAEK